jgi:hypothetical protein
MMTIEILTYGIGAGVVGDITTKAERGGLMGVFQGREYIRGTKLTLLQTSANALLCNSPDDG